MDNPIPSPHDTSLPGPTPGRTSTPTSPSHPPPVHSNNIHQPYNVQRRIRQQGPAGGRSNASPSLRQSWLFPTNRASPSTALPETTSVMTLNQRPQNMRSDPSSSTSSNSASAVSPTVPPNAGMNHKERRNFSGSARSRLTKIDRLSKMMLITNASSPNLSTGASTGLPRAASPRRARLSLQSQSGTAKEVTSAASAAAAAATTSPVKIHGSGTSKTGKVGSPTSAVFKGSRQAFGASHTTASNNYPRHIVMRAASPHCILDDVMDSDAATDSFSTSLPMASGFAAGVDPSINSEPAVTPVNAEKTNRHASMPPLPKPGWRLYDVHDVEESSNSQHGQDERAGFDAGTIGSGGSDERSIFHYSASNASSTTHLDHYPYSHQASHARQDSTTSTYYTMTPNASNLDLSMPMSNHNLSSIDPSTDSNSSVTSQGHSHQSPTPTPSIYNMPPPLPKAIKNNKSPLALRRSSTTSSSSSSSPSNTYLNKGSFPKSSLSSTMIHNSKTLTQERQKIILEILRTERSYVDGLVILQTLFYEPLNAPYATSGYPYSGANTTTSIYSTTNTTLQHNNTNKHPNPNNNNGYSGWSGATNPAASTSTLSLAAGQYPNSTVGSNSTLAASAAPLLPKKSVSEIFSNFSEILQINTLLLTQLETRICGTTYSTGWESDEDETEGRDGDEDGGDDNDEVGGSGSRESKEKGKPNQVLVTVGSQAGEKEQLLVLDADWCVGDIFIEIAPFLKMYSNYVKTYTSALTHINECMNRNDRFTEFLKSTARRPECKNLDFQSYLMLPVQRIPRYRMLLEGLLRHTPEEHPDHRKLQTAFESMEQTANFVNETIRQHEMFGEMVGLQSKITGMNEPLIIPGRVMLKRGNVWKVCRRNVQLRMIILFSDCIVWTSPSLNPLDDTLTFHRKVGLENCTVVGAEDPDPTKNAFQIMSPEKSSQVYVDTPREKEAWMVAIRRATQEYLSAKRTLKISITPMQSISAAATSFGAGLLRRETGLWSPTSFGYDSRAQTFAGHQQQQLGSAESEVSSPWSTTFGGGFASAIGSGGSGANGNGGAGPGSPPPKTRPLRVIENYNAPVWVPDQSATRCMICSEEFGTLFRRKHHCRACGKVVCHSCSSRTILIKGAHSEKVGRACDDCIETMFPEEASTPTSPTADSNSAEISPIESPGQQQQQQAQSNNPHQVVTDRRASNQSLDGIVVRPEDYNQDSGIASGATGMVRGIVEAGLNRMKSRTGPIASNQDISSGQNGGSPNSTRGSNRKSDASLGSPNENQNNVKACELCKTEFNLFKFKWRNVCSQCRRVVCSDCLTKKQIDQLFLLGLEAEREAEAEAREGGDCQVENDGQVVDSLALNSPLASPASPDLTRPGLLQSASDSVVATGTADTAATAAASLSTKRSQSFNVDQATSPSTATSGGGGYGGFGTGWRGIKSNTDSGHGQAEKLCDPCYLGLSSDQIKVLESGGGWQYYQATLGKHQTQDVIAALAMAHLTVDDGEEGAGEEDEDEDEESPVDAMRFVGSDAIGVEVSPVQAG